MIFLCFNINDRERIAEPLLQHLRSFGFFVWYDRKDIFIGDNRYEMNIIKGAGNYNLKYSIVIFTDNFDKGNFCKEELSILKQRYLKHTINIFPIIYDMKLKDISPDYKWLLDLVCKFIDNETEIIYACYHIISKITNDLLNNAKYTCLNDFIKKGNEKFLIDCIKYYEAIDKYNYSARMSAIYFIFLYIKENNNIYLLEPFYYRGFDKLFSFTKLNIHTDKREIQILENLLTLLLSIYY